MTDKFEFKVGDICSYMGLKGKVIDVLSERDADMFTIKFHSEDGGLFSFTKDGRRHPEHTLPSLTLIERPKRKVKRWVNLYSGNYYKYGEDFHGYSFSSKREADLDASREGGEGRIACVEIEVEE